MNAAFAWLKEPTVKKLVAAYAKAGHELRFVGGCVRDALLERPVRDIDACTDCPPEIGTQLLQEAGIKVVPTGIAHGTITAVVDHRPFEITTLRRDVETDGRHAQIVYTHDYEEDAARRDFTMNAIYCDAKGNLTDFHNGIDDAKAGIIRFIGDASARIEEDALRILRLFRFYASYGQAPLDNEALEACKSHREMLQQLSGERVQHEMLRLLMGERPVEAIKQLQACGLAPHVWQKKQTLNALEKALNGEEKLGMSPNAVVRLAAVLHSREAAEWVGAHWRLPKRAAQHLVQLVEVRHEGCKDVKAAMVEHGAEFATHCVLIAYACNKTTETQLTEDTKILANWNPPAFPVSGADLKKKGVAEGKEMGETLATLKARWAESDYSLSKSALLSSLTGASA